MNLQECAELCFDCAQDCERCYGGIINGDMEQNLKLAGLTRDCSDLCVLCAQVMARESDQYKAFCRLCAEICEECAKECDKMDNEMCRKCAETCRRCAEMCRQMAS